MVDIFFLEFKEDIPYFLKTRQPQDIAIALTPEICAELESKNISYNTLSGNYYSYEEYQSIFPECQQRLDTVVATLHRKFLAFDDEYKKSGINFFEMLGYFFKFLLDSLMSQVFELDQLFSKIKVEKVKLITRKEPFSYQGYLFSEDSSNYTQLIYLMQDKYHYEIEAIAANEQERPAQPAYNHLRGLDIYRQLKRSIKNIFIFKTYFLKSPIKKGNILSVDCDELLHIEQDLTKLGWSIHQLPKQILGQQISRKKESNFLAGELDKDESLGNLFKFREVNFWEVIKPRLIFFSNNLEYLYNSYKALSNYIGKHNFDIIFFITHSCFKPENVILPFICKKQKIPYICWMHGGYGANYSAAGYDITDYAFGQHYFVYGQKVKELIDNYYSKYNLTTHIAGSPKILKTYKDYTPPKNKKKVIIFPLGPWHKNDQYIVKGNPYIRFSYWEPLKAITELLAQYQHKYRIIIRSHNISSQINTVKKLLERYQAKNIEIITTAQTVFKNMVSISDLFIYTWVSTTFWESCFSHADIFLMDNSDLTEDAKNIIPNRTFWYDNLEEFNRNLRQYLDRGVFYQKNKDQSFLKEYMDYDRKKNIAEHISQLMGEIASYN
ncbi:MAG: hypothetical protein KBB01_01970 [Candidatus Omnitrophica bacterium]|jgi:hypothetical protein|nr:hypothetical protein [Candidatus Omnitrophota bacterium]